jgi:hypothetical protein
MLLHAKDRSTSQRHHGFAIPIFNPNEAEAMMDDLRIESGAGPEQLAILSAMAGSTQLTIGTHPTSADAAAAPLDIVAAAVAALTSLSAVLVIGTSSLLSSPEQVFE